MHIRAVIPPDRTFDVRAAVGLALAVLAIHIATNLVTPYEFHRDEFLYFAMGDHLRLWRMDFPPFIAIIARLSKMLFGTYLPGLRLAPAFSHAAIVFCAGYSASVFGAGRSGQLLAALAVATPPLFLRAGSLFQPVTFDQLWWTLTLVALALRIRDDDRKHWLGIGVFLGLAALTKFSVAFLAAGLIAAIVLTPLRRDLLTKWPWLASLIAIVIGHPAIIGQVALGWPVVHQMSDLQKSQLSHVGPLDFFSQQLTLGPVLLVAALGLVWMFRANGVSAAIRGSERTRVDDGSAGSLDVRIIAHDWRPIAITTATAFIILLVMRGKAYYIGPIYPILAGAGAAALTAIGERVAPKRPTKVLALMGAAVAVYGLATLPFGLPLLAPNDMVGFAALFGSSSSTRTNTGEQLALPQDYADMTGWSAMVDSVARVWRTLPSSDTVSAAIIGANYGRAGAIDLLGPARGLPAAISAAGSYWFFGPGSRTANPAVIIGGDAETLQRFYRDVSEVSRVRNSWGVTEEQSVPIYVARNPLMPISKVWPSLAGQN